MEQLETSDQAKSRGANSVSFPCSLKWDMFLIHFCFSIILVDSTVQTDLVSLINYVLNTMHHLWLSLIHWNWNSISMPWCGYLSSWLIINVEFQVIQRKLVQVVTPSTTTDRNMGPDAVYLLAIKEVCNDYRLTIFFCSNMFLVKLSQIAVSCPSSISKYC